MSDVQANPLTDSLRMAIQLEARATRLLLDEVAQKAKLDEAYKQRLAKEPEKAVQEAVDNLPPAERKAIGAQQVAQVAQVVRATSSVLPEIDVAKVQELVFGTIEDARRSFKLSLRLTQVLFYSGLVMVAVAFGVLVVFQTDQVASLVFGATGVSGVITALILNPLDRVQNAAGNLIQLEISFLSYYKILYLFNRPPGELGVDDTIRVSQEIRSLSEKLVATIEQYGERRGDQTPPTDPRPSGQPAQ